MSDWHILGGSESGVNEVYFMHVAPPSTLQAVCSTFEHLTRITLRLWIEQYDRCEEVCREVAHGLSHASNLQRLEPDNRVSDCFELFDEIANMASENLWPKLETMKVTGTTNSKSLKRIVCMSAESLRVLTLVDIALIDEG